MFVDSFIEMPFDLSQVFFVATANVLELVPVALRDRLEVIELEGYSEEEKFEIARKHLIPRGAREHGLRDDHLRVTDEAIRYMIRRHTREAGVRDLTRAIATLCRKVVLRRAEGDEAAVKITPESVDHMLGAPKRFDEDVCGPCETSGVCHRALRACGGGRPVARRSPQNEGQRRTDPDWQSGAHTNGVRGGPRGPGCVRTPTAVRSIRPSTRRPTCTCTLRTEARRRMDRPPGSPLSVRSSPSSLGGPVRGDVAMTGEISLSGAVLPVGGIRQKVLAARRYGIVDIVVPKPNERDVNEDLSDQVRGEINVHYVSTIEEALRIAFEPPISV